jgi:sugar phosphate isomerase/epimerase
VLNLAVIGDEISQDLTVALNLLTKHSYQGIEIRSVWNTRPHELSSDQCRRIKGMVTDAGLELVAYDTPVFKHELPRTPAAIDAATRLLESCIAIARELGSPLTRVFSFYRDGPPNPDAAAETMAVLLDRVPCPDVPLIVENGMRTNSPTALTLTALLKLLTPHALPALWDPGNASFSGLERTPALEAYELLRSKLALVHVKDPRGSAFYTRVGEGDVPWTEIVRQLVAHRFTGYVSLETHWRLHRILSQPERDEPWGDDFSVDGYEPSDLCMTTLSDMAARSAPPSDS